MIDFSEKKIDFVSNLNVIQLREISSVKKTCVFKLKAYGLECFAVFKFGKLANLYCSPIDLKNLLVEGLFNENFISNEVYRCFKNADLSLLQALECIKSENLIPEEISEAIKNNFHLEFIQQLLFDRSSEYFHIGQTDFVDKLKELHFECILDESKIGEQFVGHLILDSYLDRKKIEETYELGNCVEIGEVRDVLFKAAQFEDTNVPLEKILSKIPGLVGFSLQKLDHCIKTNELKFNDVIFEDEISGLDQSHSIVDTYETGEVPPKILKKNIVSNKKLIFGNSIKLGKIIGVFSLIGTVILFVKMFTLVSVFKVLFLEI